MQTNIQKWGNSLAVRIPKALADQARISLGSVVEVRLVNDVLQIAPVQPEQYTLEALLGAVTAENQHGEADMGLPQGKEVW